jgi:hypothetical protein
MTYVKTNCGGYLRMSHVREFRYEGQRSVALELDNGAQRKISRGSWDEALRCDGWERVAALPGTFVLRQGTEAEGGGTVREPVVAWAHTGFGQVYAVTMLGVHSSDCDWPIILFPDGTVRDPDRCFESYEQWLENEQSSEGDNTTEADRIVN